MIVRDFFDQLDQKGSRFGLIVPYSSNTLEGKVRSLELVGEGLYVPKSLCKAARTLKKQQQLLAHTKFFQRDLYDEVLQRLSSRGYTPVDEGTREDHDTRATAADDSLPTPPDTIPDCLVRDIALRCSQLGVVFTQPPAEADGTLFARAVAGCVAIVVSGDTDVPLYPVHFLGQILLTDCPGRLDGKFAVINPGSLMNHMMSLHGQHTQETRQAIASEYSTYMAALLFCGLLTGHDYMYTRADDSSPPVLPSTGWKKKALDMFHEWMIAHKRGADAVAELKNLILQHKPVVRFRPH